MAQDRSSILRPMAPGRLTLVHMALIVLFGLVILIPGTLPSVRPLTAHEVLAAQPAREMLRDGHWIVQTFAGVPRYEKPPTMGWLIAASMTILNRQSEWVVRLPAVLSGIAAALFVGMLAARWMGAMVGVFTALIQLTSYWVLKQAVLAEADMPLAAAITAAFALFALGNVEHPWGTVNRPWVRRMFMFAVGLAFLLKGPVALLFVFSGCALYIVLMRQWRALRFFADPVGLIILAVMLVAWPAAVLIADPSAMKIWKQELTGYAGAETFGRSSVWLYAHDVPLMLLPWFGLLIVTIITTIRHRLHRLPLTVFLFSWFAPGMLVLQLAAYKSAHYTFPLLPPASIAMAAGLIWWLRRQTTRPVFAQLPLAIIIAVAGLAGAIAIGIFAPALPGSIPAVILLCAGGFAVAVLLERARQVRLEVAVLFATVSVGIILTDLLIFPHLPGAWSRKEFAQEINRRVPAGQTLYLVDFDTDETVWYLDMPLARYDSLKRFNEAVDLPDSGIYALVRERTLNKLPPEDRWEELGRVAEPKRSDAKVPGESRLPVLIRLRPAPPASPASQPDTMPAVGQ